MTSNGQPADEEPVRFLSSVPPHVLKRVFGAEKTLRAGLPLPNYSPEEWCMLLMVKVGQLSLTVVDEDLETFQGNLETIAVAAIHALEVTTETTDTT